MGFEENKREIVKGFPSWKKTFGNIIIYEVAEFVFQEKAFDDIIVDEEEEEIMKKEAEKKKKEKAGINVSPDYVSGIQEIKIIHNFQTLLLI